MTSSTSPTFNYTSCTCRGTPGAASDSTSPTSKMLVSGDVVYDDDDDMVDFLAESSRRDYRASMRRLLSLEVDTVIPGHGDLFSQERLTQIAERYLRAN